MENFIKISELKEGDKLILRDTNTRYRDYEFFSASNGIARIVCPSGAILPYTEEEINKEFKSVWGRR